MGMVHGGMLYALADVVTGLTARADGKKYVTQSAHVNFIRNVSDGTVHAKGILVQYHAAVHSIFLLLFFSQAEHVHRHICKEISFLICHLTPHDRDRTATASQT